MLRARAAPRRSAAAHGREARFNRSVRAAAHRAGTCSPSSVVCAGDVPWRTPSVVGFSLLRLPYKRYPTTVMLPTGASVLTSLQSCGDRTASSKRHDYLHDAPAHQAWLRHVRGDEAGAAGRAQTRRGRSNGCSYARKRRGRPGRLRGLSTYTASTIRTCSRPDSAAGRISTTRRPGPAPCISSRFIAG